MEQTIDRLFQSIEQPSPQAQQVRRQWQNKPSDEVAAQGRKLLYGVVSRALHGDETVLREIEQSPQLVEEIEAYFECVFQKAEESSTSRASRRTTQSSSS